MLGLTRAHSAAHDAGIMELLFRTHSAAHLPERLARRADKSGIGPLAAFAHSPLYDARGCPPDK